MVRGASPGLKVKPLGKQYDVVAEIKAGDKGRKQINQSEASIQQKITEALQLEIGIFADKKVMIPFYLFSIFANLCTFLKNLFLHKMSEEEADQCQAPIDHFADRTELAWRVRGVVHAGQGSP